MRSLSAFLNCRESIASQIGRTRRSGIPPAKPNLEAIEEEEFCRGGGEKKVLSVDREYQFAVRTGYGRRSETVQIKEANEKPNQSVWVR